MKFVAFEIRSFITGHLLVFGQWKFETAGYGRFIFYNDSYSGLTHETRKIPSSRHVSYRGGPFTSFSRSFTGHNPPLLYPVKPVSSSNYYLKIQFVPQKNMSCSLQGLINSVYANICSFWGSQKHINEQCKIIQSFQYEARATYNYHNDFNWMWLLVRATKVPLTDVIRDKRLRIIFYR